MSEIPKRYEELHNLTFKNKEILKKYKKCLCIYCGKEFDVSEIDSWVKDKNNLTAQCPYCFIDSVIPKKIDNQEISKEELNNLYKYYF